MDYPCPVCKHAEALYQDSKPIKKMFLDKGVKITKNYYMSVCSNCNNVYCYKIDVTAATGSEESKYI